MVAGSDDIDTACEQLFGYLCGDAGAAGGVLTVGYDKIRRILLYHPWQLCQHRFPAGLPEYVADE